MTDSEKIENLLQSHTAANNFLAMQLMQTVLHYSFEQAYSKLGLLNRNDEILLLEIAEFKIEYKVDLQRIIYAPTSYADIYRSVFFRGAELPDFKKRLFSDDDSVLSLGEFGTVDELPEIREDLRSLCSTVKDFWQKMQED